MPTRARGRRASPTCRSRSARRAASRASGARAGSRADITRDGRARARARRRRALLRGRATPSVTRLPIFLIFACELLELGRGMARLERIVSLIVVSHVPKYKRDVARCAHFHRAPTSRSAPREQTSFPNSRSRGQKSPICEELHSENFMLIFLIWENAWGEFAYPLIRLRTAHISAIVVRDESISRQERNGTETISRQPMPCGRFRSGGQDAPAPPRRACRTFTGRLARAARRLAFASFKLGL